MENIDNLVKIGYTDSTQFCVYTYISNMGRVILEQKIPEEHISLRKKHWVNLLEKIMAGEIIDKIPLYKENIINVA